MENKQINKINFGSLNYSGWEMPLSIENQIKKFEELKPTEEELIWEIIINKEENE